MPDSSSGDFFTGLGNLVNSGASAFSNVYGAIQNANAQPAQSITYAYPVVQPTTQPASSASFNPTMLLIGGAALVLVLVLMK